MKKTTKYIIITLVVLIVLGAAAAALILTSPKDGEDDASNSSTVSESTEPALIDKTAEDVKNIGIEDLAADDEMARRAVKMQRNGAHGAKILRHILADRAVAAIHKRFFEK